jgi:phage-related protein
VFEGVSKSEEWQVSKVSGFFGGMLGGTGPGIGQGSAKDVLKNVGGSALKWGLIGAGAGSFIPVVGTAIGAGVGVLIGTVLGFFGGEKIAKAFNAMGKWIGDMWEKVTEAVKQAFTDIVDWFKEKFAWAKDKVVGFGQKAGAAVATAWTDATTFIRDKVWTPIVTWFTNLWAWAEAGIAEGWTNVTTFITKLWGDVKTWFTELWEWASGGIAEGWTNVTDFIKGKWDVVVEWFEGLWEWASPVTDFSITGTLENVIRTIKEWLFGGEGKTGILQFKIPTIKLPDIGLEMKAKAAGIAAYAKAALQYLATLLWVF